MTPKQIEQINRGIEKALGWRQVEVEEMSMHFPGGMLPSKVKRWSQQTEGQIIVGGCYELPSFATDERTRPQLLAALSYIEKRNLLHTWFLQYKLGNPAIDFDIGILELDQATLCKLFCAVKNEIDL